MKKNEDNHVGAIVAGIIVVALLFVVILLLLPVKMDVNCAANGIEYKNVSECYGDFDASHCPMPSDIQCEIKGSAPAILVLSFR